MTALRHRRRQLRRGERARARHAAVRDASGAALGWFATEGLLGGHITDPPCACPRPDRKPSFFAIRALIRNEIAR